LDEVSVDAMPPSRFDTILPAARSEQFGAALGRARTRLAGHTLWHVNSTEQGGGVAEMLQSLVGYLAGADITTRWLVIDGDPAFFDVTKRVHFRLHGAPGDGGCMTADDRDVYESSLGREERDAIRLVRPGDTVVLHDPQTVGLARTLRDAGASVIWSCHVGADAANEHTRDAWRFLMPYVSASHAQVFSRRQYIWDPLADASVVVIPPCIDAFSPKNTHLEPSEVTAILDAARVVPTGGHADATTGGAARMVEDGPVPPAAPIVTQVSRWDPLKDHAGVMEAFSLHVPAETGAHLVLAGPDPDAIADDPGSRSTFQALQAARDALEPSTRRRVHLACLPMTDVDRNALIVNALQRRADVVVQKSRAEGFGLTVTEAMWKGRPTVGSAVGGIQDQIEHGRAGWLVDPDDLPALGAAIVALLGDPASAAEMGRLARERVIDEYLVPTHLSRYLSLIDSV
jgi:trehalose synthase